MGLAVAFFAALGFGTASSVFPVFDSETYLVALGVTSAHATAVVTALGLGTGQSIGKLVLFLLVRRGRMAAAGEGRFHDSLLGLLRRTATRLRLRRHAREPVPVGAYGGELTGAVEEFEAELKAEADAPPAHPSRWRRFRALVVRWGERGLQLLDRPVAAFGVVLSSASLGAPPLALTTIAAGVARTPWPVFSVATLVGRLGRFLLLAYLISFLHRGS